MTLNSDELEALYKKAITGCDKSVADFYTHDKFKGVYDGEVGEEVESFHIRYNTQFCSMSSISQNKPRTMGTGRRTDVVTVNMQ